MSYVGKWVVHSVGIMGEEEIIYLDTESYLKSPMPPYVDETDEDAVAEELRDRKTMVSTQIEICEDGKMYMLMPLPEGVTQEEVDAAVAAGEINLRGGMMTQDPETWEERDGVLWYTTGMSEDGWTRGSDEDGFVVFMTTKFTKAE
ncbi:MAG: hypothetical protein IJF27_01600 [Oscillospiraceae bacterium]|nr:hypothetical protein [Oscillospiraceae bacterium]